MMNGAQTVLAVLIAERDCLNQAIAILQGGSSLAAPKRRGRPPGTKNKTTPTPQRTRQMSPAARKAASARMKKYWAQRRKEKSAK